MRRFPTPATGIFLLSRLMARDEISEYSPKENERAERREKKRQPKMRVTGRGVVELARIISKRVEEASQGGSKRKQRRRKRKK